MIALTAKPVGSQFTNARSTVANKDILHKQIGKHGDNLDAYAPWPLCKSVPLVKQDEAYLSPTSKSPEYRWYEAV